MAELLQRFQPLDLDLISVHTQRINNMYDIGVTLRTAPLLGPAFEATDGFPGLSLRELKQLGLNVLNCGNITEVYDLLAQPPQDGQATYYDRVLGPQHIRAYDLLDQVFTQFENEKVENGLDVAAGTGVSSEVLAKYCRNVTATDSNPKMLAVAEKRLEALEQTGALKGHTTLIRDAVDLLLPPESFDIVLANGLYAYLNSEEITAFHSQVADVLKGGGRFYYYFVDSKEYDASDIYNTSPKGKLAGYVVQALLKFSQLDALNQTGLTLDRDPNRFDGGMYEVRGMPYKEYLIRWVKR